MVRDRGDIERDIQELSARLDAQGESPGENNIHRALLLLADVETYLKGSVADSGLQSNTKPNIIVLGTTGAGKSTIVTFLFGSGRLVVQHEGHYSRVLVADPALPGVEIRSGPISSTLLPVVSHVNLGSGPVAVWDMPGSRDTRGSFAELIVHLIFKWLLKDGRETRFLLVSPPLHERPQRLMLQNLINGSLVREDNAVVVYTKCTTNFDPRSTADLDIEESKRNICSFALPAPDQDDRDGHDYSLEHLTRKQNILTALNSLHSRQVVYDKPLPAAAKLLLDHLTRACVKFVREKLSTIFLAVYEWDKYRETFDKINLTIEEFKYGDVMTLETVLDLLESLAPTIRQHLQQDQGFLCARDRLYTMATLNSCDQYCSMGKWLSPDAKIALEIAKENLLELRKAVKVYRRSEKLSIAPNTLVISAFRLRLSEEQATIDKFVKKREMAIDSVEMIPTVILIGFASLEVDVGLQMWANVALVSPSIQVTTEYAFDLSAVGQAASAKKCNDVAGRDGIHGRPGLPGGNLAVICGNLADDAQSLRATLSCGQRGGDAQDGADGINGADSAYDSDAFLKAINAELHGGILSKTGKKVPRDLKDGLRLIRFDAVDSPLAGSVYGTPGRKDLTIARNPEPGNPRRPAGSGGRGGAGGKGGVVHIRSSQDGWQGAGPIGHRGLDGAPGAASRDGFSSPNFTATIQQWYCKGGWFGNHTSKPKRDISTDPVHLDDQSKLIHAKPATGKGDDAEDNTALNLDFVRAKYKKQRERLEETSPKCDFSDLTIDCWDVTQP
ncbi:hypothetical protein PF011_g12343 [Phytophthora fragariae]|uniref:G domain-containing protein n=3 Tax=Phytophthora fragariae TaxID=53985 RepID=A0A6A3KBX9_9STRA|nr:hypothetical protein PF003_g25340 [Phytophthora fragariae]KAE9004711.1 hypothetical protein PF011_g12343 [Phytophthora fragariae]